MLNAGLQPVREEDEVAPLNSYLRWLPCVFDPAKDKRQWYTQLMFAQHAAHLGPGAGTQPGHWSSRHHLLQPRNTHATAKAFPTICNFPGPRPRCVPAWIAPVQKASSRSKPPKLHNRVLRRRQRCA
ncbi:hypothetical protein RLIN73S_05888 [Rhodanobacter lindaniclasticus]